MLNVGVIGCGRVGYLFEHDKKRGHPCTHIGAVMKCDRLNLRACCDIDNTKLDIVKKEFEGANTYTDYNIMMQKEDLDIVVIATNTETHYEIACSVIDKVKGLVLEKPVFSNTLQANDFGLKIGNVKVAVNHHRRYSNRVREVKRIIDEKRYGKVISVCCNMFSIVPPKLEREIYTGGILYHDGTHMLDLMLYFFGEAESFKAYGKRYGKKYIETEAQVILKHKDHDFINIINCRGGSEYFFFEFRIFFERGEVLYYNPVFYLYELCDSPYFDGFKDLRRSNFFDRVFEGNLFVNLYYDLADSIINNRKPLSSFEDGNYVLMFIENIYKDMVFR